MSFATKFAALRSASGMTQDEVAKKLVPEMTPQVVSKWEKGSIPRLPVIKQLAAMFGVTVSDLMDDERPIGSILPTSSGTMVPVLGTAHMESFEDIEDTGFEAEVPSHVVKSHPRAFLIHGFGPCMNKRFPEDALLLVDPDMEPRNGDAVLVEDEDHRALVRVFTRGSSTLMLSPDSWSEDINDIVGSPEDPPVRLVGVVVWYQAREDLCRATG